jgi:ribonuclease III
MKTTSFKHSEATHRTFLSHCIFKSKENLSALNQNSKLFIENIIEKDATYKGIANLFYWSDERVLKGSLIEAWTHKSYLNELGDHPYQSYERWEFLGDSVFGNFITEQLFAKFQSKNEGQLSKLKSQLVSGNMMSKLAVSSGLDQLIILGKGEVKRESFKNPALLADIFEATIGVLSLRLPKDELVCFLEGVISTYENINSTNFYNAESLLKKEVKGELQELTMRRFKTLPDYQSKETKKGFEINLYIDGKFYGQEVNQSKKMAQKLCAEKAIKELNLN